ncbi:FtsX-like permease family protein [Metallumcola ferriviriculae]|uniref:FtsX-like permease family protein n=1 Tax=Metallumcola ferriviriculae TaxID=3039180 RepID=A0AAU0UNE0_9FIRM|nr:FtsX-like permease family protein [Desulfitibacteraceae bacterium MK1]
MRLDSIAINSLKRRKVKMAFLLLGMVVAMGTVVTMYSITTAMNQELANTFDEIGANIMVMPKNDDLSLSYGGVNIPAGNGEGSMLTNNDIIKINTIPNRDNIAFVAPKILGLAEFNGQDLMLVGVDFPYELKLKKWWQYRGEKPVAVDHLLLGSTVAKKYGKDPGDSMEIKGRKFKVAAVLEPQGTEEDGLVFMHLLTAQDLLGKKNKLSFIEVAAYCTTCPIDQITTDIEKSVPGARATALAESVRARQQVIDRFTNFSFAVSLVVVLIGALVVMLTMMSSVSERTAEIGIYRAMGFRKSNIFEIILTEAGVIGIVGGVLGYVVGILAAKLLAPGIAQMQISIPWNPLIGVTVVLIATAVGILASAYPAIQAAKLDPVEALQYI